MSTKKRKSVLYLSHDADARNDPKILAAESVYGEVAYAWFFKLLEMMRTQAGYKLSLEGKYAYQAIADGIRCRDHGKLRSFIHDCINEFRTEEGGLFESDGKWLWSASFLYRMEQMEEKSRLASEKARKRWEESQRKGKDEAEQPDPSQSDATASLFDATASESDAPASKSDALKERIGKDRIGNEMREGESARAPAHAPASDASQGEQSERSLEHITRLFEQNGCPGNARSEAESFIDYRNDKGWGNDVEGAVRRWIRQMGKFGNSPSIQKPQLTPKRKVSQQPASSPPPQEPVPRERVHQLLSEQVPDLARQLSANR